MIKIVFELLFGGYNWCGVVVVYVNGDFYVVNGWYVYWLLLDFDVVGEYKLVMDNVYNGYVIVLDGNFIMKDI